MQKATRNHTKEHNRNLVLKTIIGHTSISRAEIARITSLTRTTVSDIVNDLISEGLVNEIGVGSSVGGKSPILLSLVENSRLLIGLELASNQFRGAIVNLRGEIRDLVVKPVENCNGDQALSVVFEILDQLLRKNSLPFWGIGVGTPGLVNTSEGMVINSVNLDWKNFTLGRLIKDRYHLPVYVLNDSQAAAIGEYSYGYDHQADEQLVVINVHQGIGAGIIINGTLFQGDDGSAGEIGHIVVVPEGGLLCRCGKTGCLETVASVQAVINQTQELAEQNPGSLLWKSGQKITFEQVEKAFWNEDPLAVQIVEQTGRYMGLAISNLVGILNIRKIVLVGDMTRFGEPWLNTIRMVIEQMAIPGAPHNTQVEIGRLNGNEIILGASALFANNYSMLFN